MTFWEKVIFLVGFALVWGHPFCFLISGFQLFLLITYFITVAGFFMTLRTFLCSQCVNTVKNEVRRDFFDRNPEVAKTWTIKH
jgi:hypothetical protein